MGSFVPELWPFPPLTPCDERLQWATDVMMGLEDEQRIALRPAPRQVLPMKHRLVPEDYVAAMAIARRYQEADWYVPVWHEGVRLANVAAATTALSFDTTAGDFRDRILLWSSRTSYHLADLDAVASGSVTLATGPAADLATPLAVPVRAGYIRQPFGFSDQLGYGEVEVTFETDDIGDLGTNPYGTFGAESVLSTPPQAAAGVAQSQGTPWGAVDIGIGAPDLYRLRDWQSGLWQVELLDETRAATWSRRRWLHALRGRQKSFWVPSWASDLVLAAAIGAADTQMTVSGELAEALVDGQSAMIRLTTGQQIYTALSFVSAGSGQTVIGITAPAQDIAVAQVDRISFMARARLDTDEVRMKHYLEGHSRTGLVLRTVPA